jgi:hypothetical protein
VDAAGTVDLVWGAVIFVFSAVFVFAVFRKRRRGRVLTPGPGAAGSIYELLNQDKRNAVELIVEEKAEARDPEYADDIVK